MTGSWLSDDGHSVRRRLVTLLDSAMEALCVIDADANILWVSPSVESMLGWKPEDLDGRVVFDLALDADRARAARAHGDLLAGRDVAGPAIVRLACKDGSTRTVEATIRNMLDDEDISGIVIRCRDVTERERWSRALRESESRYHKTFISAPDGIVISREPDGRFLDANESFEQLTGYGKDEIIGRTAADLNLWVEPAERDRLLETIEREGRVRGFQASLRRKDGEVRIGQLSVEVVEIDGETCLLTTTRDVTEEIRTRESLQQTTEQLRVEHDELSEKNIALREVLRHLDEQKAALRKELADGVASLLQPFVERVRSTGQLGEADLRMLERRVRGLVGDEHDELRAKMQKLTPRELDICELIRTGRSSREIAEELGLSTETIHKHRQAIRRKLQIDHRGINLSTYLRSQ